MVAYDTLVGEFRVHYAGFFDPGFGADAAGGGGKGEAGGAGGGGAEGAGSGAQGSQIAVTHLPASVVFRGGEF